MNSFGDVWWETIVVGIDEGWLDWWTTDDSCRCCPFGCPLFTNELIQRFCIRESIDQGYFRRIDVDEGKVKDGLILFEELGLSD
jgi:hypothetical protein